jgi:hypothetical protein
MFDTCLKCGSSSRRINVGQACVQGRLEWHKAYSCPRCGNDVHEDGIGDLDASSRDAILRDEGQYSLFVQASGPEGLLILKSLREVLGWPLTYVTALKRKLPGEVARGTRVEMECIRSRVPGDAAAISIRKIEESAERSLATGAK